MKKYVCLLLCLLFVLAACLPDRLTAEDFKENDRIGWSADGNMHDPDDWGATALALAIFAKQGWQNKLVHIDYNNWLPGNTPLKAAHETISVLEGTAK